jgi:hypothetical protein
MHIHDATPPRRYDNEEDKRSSSFARRGSSLSALNATSSVESLPPSPLPLTRSPC